MSNGVLDKGYRGRIGPGIELGESFPGLSGMTQDEAIAFYCMTQEVRQKAESAFPAYPATEFVPRETVKGLGVGYIPEHEIEGHERPGPDSPIVERLFDL